MPPLYIATIHKNGSSLAVVIPREMCRAVPLERGDKMGVVLKKQGTVSFTKINPRDIPRDIDY